MLSATKMLPPNVVQNNSLCWNTSKRKCVGCCFYPKPWMTPTLKTVVGAITAQHRGCASSPLTKPVAKPARYFHNRVWRSPRDVCDPPGWNSKEQFDFSTNLDAP